MNGKNWQVPPATRSHPRLAADTAVRRRVDSFLGAMRDGIDAKVVCASPEDAALEKPVRFRDGGSENRLRVIDGILAVSTNAIDYDCLARWIVQLDVEVRWQLVRTRMPVPDGTQFRQHIFERPPDISHRPHSRI